jgi:hypothetical protein
MLSALELTNQHFISISVDDKTIYLYHYLFHFVTFLRKPASVSRQESNSRLSRDLRHKAARKPRLLPQGGQEYTASRRLAPGQVVFGEVRYSSGVQGNRSVSALLYSSKIKTT